MTMKTQVTSGARLWAALRKDKGSVRHTQDIRVRVHSSSSRSRSASTQRQELEENFVPNGDSSVPNLPPRSRLRQTTTNGRMGMSRSGRDDEEKHEAFTGFDELDAIAAAKPQEETSKVRSSPTITRSNKALPGKSVPEKILRLKKLR